MDELSFDEGDFGQMYYQDVGHISGQSWFLIIPCDVTVSEIGLDVNADIQAEGTDAFSQFHLYVCSALLVKYSERLREMDFQVSFTTLSPMTFRPT